MSSSDEAEETSPVLPRDSDRGSSVSSLLQDEYEELLRSAVVTPRLDAAGGGQLLLGTSSLRSLRSLEGDDRARQRHPAAAAGRSASRASSVKTPTPAQRSSRQTGRSPAPSHRSSGQSEKTSSPPQRSRQASRSPTPSQRSRQASRSPTPSQRSRQASRSPTPSQRSRQASRSPTPSQRSRQASRSPTPSQRSRQMERSPAPSQRSRQMERSPAPSQRSRQMERSPAPSQRSRQMERSPAPSQRSRQASRSPAPSQRSRQMERSPAPSQRSRPRSRQSERTPSPSQRSSTRQTSPKPSSSDALLTELFICEENISQMENLLDTWSVHLKSNVVAELRRWRLLFVEQHQRELGRERDRVHVLQAEAEDLRQLLEAYQTSGHRKDTVISNLTAALDRQREKVDMMRTLTHWRLQHSHRQDEAHALRRAQQHHHAVLKRKVFLGWHSLHRCHWKDTVERDCRTRAQDVCTRLAAQYDTKLAEHVQALETAQAEMERLRLERERYEDAMKKSFMRGVCALNMEALSMFHNTEDTDDADSAAIGQFSSHPGSSTHFSPAHFDPTPPPSQNAPPQEAIDSTTRLPSTSVIHSSLPPGGTAGSQKSARVAVTTAAQQQQKASNKTVTARITARHAPSASQDPSARTPRNHLAKKTAHNDLVKTTAAPPRPDLVKTTRSHLHVMGVAPPMSSVMVERHHPVTQLTVGQATAAMFPRPSQHHSGGPGGKPLPHGAAHSSCDLPHARRPLLPSRHAHSSCDTHAIKIVD